VQHGLGGLRIRSDPHAIDDHAIAAPPVAPRRHGHEVRRPSGCTALVRPPSPDSPGNWMAGSTDTRPSLICTRGEADTPRQPTAVEVPPRCLRTAVDRQ